MNNFSKAFLNNERVIFVYKRADILLKSYSKLTLT